MFWQQALKLKALFYIDRVSTDANVADGPSRGREREAKQAGWKRVNARLPKVLFKGLGRTMRSGSSKTVHKNSDKSSACQRQYRRSGRSKQF